MSTNWYDWFFHNTNIRKLKIYLDGDEESIAQWHSPHNPKMLLSISTDLLYYIHIHYNYLKTLKLEGEKTSNFHQLGTTLWAIFDKLLFQILGVFLLLHWSLLTQTMLESSVIAFGLHVWSMKLHAPTASPTVRYIHSCPNTSINLDLFIFFITSPPGFASTSCEKPEISVSFALSSWMEFEDLG